MKNHTYECACCLQRQWKCLYFFAPSEEAWQMLQLLNFQKYHHTRMQTMIHFVLSLSLPSLKIMRFNCGWVCIYDQGNLGICFWLGLWASCSDFLVCSKPVLVQIWLCILEENTSFCYCKKWKCTLKIQPYGRKTPKFSSEIWVCLLLLSLL